MTGRLTLTWANKNDALISTSDGGYEWVDRSDPRANEVRLLDEVDRVGDVSGTPADNLLIRGDGLDALRALHRIPEYAAEYKGKVKLVYIDPPFNTGQAFEHYDDGLEHSVWLGMMRERLDLIADLLAPDGSVWVHLDDAEMAYARVLMDEIFGRANFVGTIVWEKADSPRNSARQFSADQDYILVYGGTPDWKPNRLPRTAESDAIYSNPDDDPRGPWLPGDPYANKPYSLGQYEITGPTGRVFSPPKGRFWRVSESRLRELDAQGRVWWGPTGNARPSIKRYLNEVSDLVPRTLWRGADVGSNRTSKNEIRALFPDESSFATPKPERLLERVIRIATDQRDVVLDVFAGSGTTAAVAHKLNRRWVTAEVEETTVDKFTTSRLRKVIAGEDSGGITSSVSWEGGGGFREMRIAPAVFEVAELGGLMVTGVSSGVDADSLSRSVAAQLGFARSHDDASPFAGRKGRSRLAVVRGVLDSASVATLLAGIEDDETLTIAATGAEPDTRAYLRTYSRGSRIVRIPDGLFPKAGVTR